MKLNLVLAGSALVLTLGMPVQHALAKVGWLCIHRHTACHNQFFHLAA